MSERLLVNVEKMAPEGEALARAAGSTRVVFVPYGVPGDALEVNVERAKSTFARARILSVKRPSGDRVEPTCPLHYAPGRSGPACGGCDWQQLRYEAQLREKRELVVDCLKRLGKFPAPDVAQTLASPQQWAYRNKVQIPFGRDEATGRPVAGFYAPASHVIVDQPVCPVQPEVSVQLALHVKAEAARLGWAVYDDRRGAGWLRHLFVRTNAQGQALLALVTRTEELHGREDFVQRARSAFPGLIGIHQNVQPLKTSVILGPKWRRVWGADYIEEAIGPFKFLVSPGAFLQVNTGAAQRLYELAAAALAGPEKFDLVLDLYCGAGTLTLFAAAAGRRCVGVEENRQAVADAWKNAQRNGVKNASFRAGRVEAVLPKLRDELPARAAAVVDPPRAGLSQPALRFLTSARLQRLVYVSCNPATFARDARYLAQSGWRLGPVRPVDLFPQTSHVELVGRFDRA